MFVIVPVPSALASDVAPVYDIDFAMNQWEARRPVPATLTGTRRRRDRNGNCGVVTFLWLAAAAVMSVNSHTSNWLTYQKNRGKREKNTPSVPLVGKNIYSKVAVLQHE